MSRPPEPPVTNGAGRGTPKPDHVPPHDHVAEREVLGACIEYPDLLDGIELAPSDFYVDGTAPSSRRSRRCAPAVASSASICCARTSPNAGYSPSPAARTGSIASRTPSRRAACQSHAYESSPASARCNKPPRASPALLSRNKTRGQHSHDSHARWHPWMRPRAGRKIASAPEIRTTSASGLGRARTAGMRSR